MDVSISEDRRAHWIKKNHQCRIPPRWVAFDTESDSVRNGRESVQTWKLGAAIRWRSDLKSGDHAEGAVFKTPAAMWKWITDHCKAGTRTVAWAHNISFDVRISDAFEQLPKLGFSLEWCNLDRNVSAMTWRSDRGTLIIADLWTWLPVPLSTIGNAVGIPKLDMPTGMDDRAVWERYCLGDTKIVYRAVSELIAYIDFEQLGNWQPTGAGMAYATWRHKFMQHKVLVHDDVSALTAERKAMHTGRAEAWRHGLLTGDLWTELDMTNAYARVAAECDLPCKLKFHTGALSIREYRSSRNRYRILVRCNVVTDNPIVPVHNGMRTIWPTGDFETYLWDPEIDIALASGAKIEIAESWMYTRHPILQEWALWALDILREGDDVVSPVVRLWMKHCSRALIGRLSLRTAAWEPFGDNPEGISGISYLVTDDSAGHQRLLHTGDSTLIETARVEGRDSLPQVTGYIMSECRARLWNTMMAAGMQNIAHVDTDSLIVNRAGLSNLNAWEEFQNGNLWHPKGSWPVLNIWGPRNYRRSGERKISGVPTSAVEETPGAFRGERWRGLATDLTAGRPAAVTIVDAIWRVQRTDPRRADSPGVGGYTCALDYRSNARTSLATSADASDGL